MILSDILRGAEAVPCHPWTRHILAPEAWDALARSLPGSPLTLLALWADTQQVHALFLDASALQILPVSTAVVDGLYPALSPTCPGAGAYERMVADLWGHIAADSTESGPWLDHGHWPQSRPMAARHDAPGMVVASGDRLEPEEPLMQLSQGPIHGPVGAASRLRLLVRDGVITAATGQVGFTHKGTLVLMRAKSPRTAARFAARLAADATVAHAVAFAAAAENAVGAAAPPRAATLRSLMLEIERIGVHLDTLAEVAGLADAALAAAQCRALRERLLRATEAAFGHRMMMDCVVPGGVALDLDERGEGMLLRALDEVDAALATIRRHHDGRLLAGRLRGRGPIDLALVTRYGAGGPAGRAAGRGFDARMLGSLPPSNAFPAFAPALSGHGDALGRQHRRIEEIATSLTLIRSALRSLPIGALTVALPSESGEGIGCAESARGDIWHWLRLDHGQIAACFPRDPAWALWPVVAAALTNADVEDADLIRASFALTVSGMDL